MTSKRGLYACKRPVQTLLAEATGQHKFFVWLSLAFYQTIKTKKSDHKHFHCYWRLLSCKWWSSSKFLLCLNDTISQCCWSNHYFLCTCSHNDVIIIAWLTHNYSKRSLAMRWSQSSSHVNSLLDFPSCLVNFILFLCFSKLKSVSCQVLIFFYFCVPIDMIRCFTKTFKRLIWISKCRHSWSIKMQLHEQLVPRKQGFLRTSESRKWSVKCERSAAAYASSAHLFGSRILHHCDEFLADLLALEPSPWITHFLFQTRVKIRRLKKKWSRNVI